MCSSDLCQRGENGLGNGTFFVDPFFISFLGALSSGRFLSAVSRQADRSNPATSSRLSLRLSLGGTALREFISEGCSFQKGCRGSALLLQQCGRYLLGLGLRGGSVRAGTNRLFSFGRSKRCRALFLFPPIRKIAPAAGGEPNAPSRKKPLSFRGMASFLKGSGRCLRDASVLRDVFFLFDGAFCLPFQACPVFPRFDLSVFRIGGRNGRPIGSADGNGLSPLLRRGRLGWLFGADAIPSFRKRKRSGSEKAVAGKNFSCRRHALFRVFFQKALVKSDRLL